MNDTSIVATKFLEASSEVLEGAPAGEDVAALIPAPTLPESTNPYVVLERESDKFTNKAKRLVVDNYNAHHNRNKTEPLTLDDVFIVSFAVILGNWKAYVASNVARGLIYQVTYNDRRSEATVEIFKRVNNVRIAD